MFWILTFSAYSDDMRCRDNPKIVDACYETRGRISLFNGNPMMRIWKVGTKRMLGVRYSENPIHPEKLAPYINFSTKIFGDYLVCPFTKEQPGHMQFVCIEEASNIRVEDYSKNLDQPEIIFID